MRGQSGAAVVAGAAVDGPGDDHQVAGGYGGQGVAGLDDSGHAFMAEGERRVDETVSGQDRGVDVAGGGRDRGDDRLLVGLELGVGCLAPFDGAPGDVGQFTHRRAAPSRGRRGRRSGLDDLGPDFSAPVPVHDRHVDHHDVGPRTGVRE